MVVATSCYSSRHLTEMHNMDPEGARFDAEIGIAMTMADGCTLTLTGRSLPDADESLSRVVGVMDTAVPKGGGLRYRYRTWTLTPLARP